jgi:predicted phosphodiesterase
MLRKMVSRFRIQYASDFHLELYDSVPKFETLLKPVAPYLALAGDIGHPPQIAALFAWAAPKWKRIFYVPGNHEYYEGILEERETELRQIAATHTIHFLHPTSSFLCEEENVVIIGGTLWSEVPYTSGWRKCKDYKRIQTGNGKSDPESVFHRLNALHKEHRRLLETEIDLWRNKGADICVITHYLPSFQLIHPHFWGSDVNPCFASSADILLQSPVRLWIYGHSHACSHHILKNVVCVSNAKGYLGERVAGWRPDVWMEFPTHDPQEIEAAHKKDQTPLQSDEIEFL